MRIRTIDTYVDELGDVADRSDEATFYHSRTWIDCLGAAFPRLSFRCLVADDSGSIAGFLPFFFVKRGPLRSAWSLPFGTYGGPVAPAPDSYRPLIAAYADALSSLRVTEVGWVDFGQIPRSDWDKRDQLTHLIDLSGGFDALWDDTVERQRKKRFRRAERLGVRVRRTRSVDDLRHYYEIYSKRIDLWGGGNRYPESLFMSLLETGDDAVRLYVAEDEKGILGGHFNFCYKGTVTAWMGVTTPESNQLQAGTLLYVHCLREACEEGFRAYNLGGSLGKQSLIDFKESLGGKPYHYSEYRRRSTLGRATSWIKRRGG